MYKLDPRALPDYSECANEPINIPGAIQPHGFLLVVDGDRRIVQSSVNATKFCELAVLGADVAAIFGNEINDVINQLCESEDAYSLVTRPLSGSERECDVTLRVDGRYVVLEAEYKDETTDVTRPFASVHAAMSRLDVAEDQRALSQVVAEEMRAITGFDRVMIYRFDEEWNGSVVAEAKHDDKDSFLGLNFPASDIPAQARALYSRQWIRLISHVDYQPVPLEPVFLDSKSLDMAHISLRSVSPVHIAYLKNMGVQASMSVSLMRQGKLWGLVACHHYDGPRYLGPAVRASAELLGRTTSLLLGTTTDNEAFEAEIYQRSTYAQLTSRVNRLPEDLSGALTSYQPSLRDLLGSSGATVCLGGDCSVVGEVLDRSVEAELIEWIQARGDRSFKTNSLARFDSRWESISDKVSGVVYEQLDDAGKSYVLWVRPERLSTVEWAGNPYEKEVDVVDGRLGPRRSFGRWAETVRFQSDRWKPHDVEIASEMGQYLSGVVSLGSAEVVELASSLRSELALGSLPRLAGLEMSVYYKPGHGDRVGGDWYDAITLTDDRLAICVGDVAGHGATVSGVMAQLRNGLRAYLLSNESGPSPALSQLNQMTEWLLPQDFATAVVGFYEPTKRLLRLAGAGHLPPVFVCRGESKLYELERAPALGIGEGFPYEDAAIQMNVGDQLVLYTDGLVEHRGEAIDSGIDRLLNACSGGVADASELVAKLNVGSDDVTVLVMTVTE